MPIPTPEQLELINRRTLEPMTEENCFVFENMMVDNQETFYGFKLHRRLLETFLQDCGEGIPLLMNHNSRQLPVGRLFDARLVDTPGDGEMITSLYGDFYIDLGRMTESGMSTDDVVKGIKSGTISDTSIGFVAETWECNICHQDVRSWHCPHFPGREYEIIDEDGNKEIIRCLPIVGRDGKGELLENSLVYSGACGRAKITGLSVEEGMQVKNGNGLQVVNSIKDVPEGTPIYCFASKSSVQFMVDGVVNLEKRSEEDVSKVNTEELEVREEELTTPVEEVEEETVDLSQEEETNLEDVELLKQEKEELTIELDQTRSELEQVKLEVETLQNTIAEKDKKIEELTAQAELAQAYRQDLIERTLAAGIRAQGNAFKTELFSRYLSSLTIDEIKETLADLEAEFDARFEGARVTKPNAAKQSKEPTHRDDFEDEQEFRTFVAEKAAELAKEKGISLTEATTEIYKKYTTKE